MRRKQDTRPHTHLLTTHKHSHTPQGLKTAYQVTKTPTGTHTLCSSHPRDLSPTSGLTLRVSQTTTAHIRVRLTRGLQHKCSEKPAGAHAPFVLRGVPTARNPARWPVGNVVLKRGRLRGGESEHSLFPACSTGLRPPLRAGGPWELVGAGARADPLCVRRPPEGARVRGGSADGSGRVWPRTAPAPALTRRGPRRPDRWRFSWWPQLGGLRHLVPLRSGGVARRGKAAPRRGAGALPAGVASEEPACGSRRLPGGAVRRPAPGGRPLPPRCGASGCRPSGPGVRSAVLRGREGPGAPLCGGGTRAGFGGLGAPAGASGARTAGLPRSRRLRLHDDGCARSRTCDDAPWRSRAARRCGFCGERRDAASGALAAGALVSAHVLPGGPSPCVTAERPARSSFAGGFC